VPERSASLRCGDADTGLDGERRELRQGDSSSRANCLKDDDQRSTIHERVHRYSAPDLLALQQHSSPVRPRTTRSPCVPHQTQSPLMPTSHQNPLEVSGAHSSRDQLLLGRPDASHEPRSALPGACMNEINNEIPGDGSSGDLHLAISNRQPDRISSNRSSTQFNSRMLMSREPSPDTTADDAAYSPRGFTRVSGTVKRRCSTGTSVSIEGGGTRDPCRNPPPSRRHQSGLFSPRNKLLRVPWWVPTQLRRKSEQPRLERRFTSLSTVAGVRASLLASFSRMEARVSTAPTSSNDQGDLDVEVPLGVRKSDSSSTRDSISLTMPVSVRFQELPNARISISLVSSRGRLDAESHTRFLDAICDTITRELVSNGVAICTERDTS